MPGTQTCQAVPPPAGCQDRIFRSESTFLVEMQETAALLCHSTRASLLVGYPRTAAGGRAVRGKTHSQASNCD